MRSTSVRGDDQQTGQLFSYLSLEQRVPQDHPLRPVREMTDAALRRLSPRFEALYSHTGRPSVPPEKLLRVLLLQILYSVRSERLLMEQLEYNLLFRWFVGLPIDDEVWTPTPFTKNRDRLLEGDIAAAFFQDVLAQARGARRAAVVGRAFHGGWDAARSVCQSEELPPQGGGAAAAGRSGESDGEFPRGAPVEHDARVDHGS
jgi:transposase